ncbi:MAG: 2-dehydropantoate 2-reductase [Anaerolineae bacterium]|nr:2-dehydropantoate 2-reductase [Anaerolineae bacterium]
MTLVIWGAGAIGGTIGAYLVRAGYDVLLVDNATEHVAAINTNGLKITGPIEEFTVQAKASTPEDVEGTFETIILATKAQHTQAATEALKPHLAENGYVLSAQNGLNELIIQDIVGKERTIGSFVNFGADYHAPGEIFFGGRGAVVLGEIDGSMTERLKKLHEIMLHFEPNAVMSDNLWGYLWGKEAYGAMLFVTALTNESIADALADRTYHNLYTAAAREILAVAGKLGIQANGFNGFVPEAFMPNGDRSQIDESLAAMVAFNRKSAKSHSGIWRDLAIRKRRTEVVMYDTIVSEAKRLNVPIPFTQHWINMIHEIEDGKREQSLANLDELKASLT